MLGRAFFFSSAEAQIAHSAKLGAVDCQLQAATDRLHVREATGRNDGPEVWATQKAAGVKKFDPWCGCEMFLQQQSCGLPSPKLPAAARTWSLPSSSRTFFVRGMRGSLDSLRPGHIVTLYYANLGRVGKVVALGRAVQAGRAPRTYLVNSGNTGRGGGRDGAGVYNVNYPAYQIYAGANWSY
ncbi:hypothetical protein DNI29_19200 [Hymenobacter sediminis]|uniref:hypothetical protein n=1 Tax=Hymenobacter sediminis TaxID=2218621 RepID=UPI000DA6D4F6|nr:hypothetical protein [Hymenobacter sediminis]RPD44837.1 hypothetical protein DNI29_19200 [Hymenobacter sediminis]